ncbi:MAG: prolipoprotein diacylglyceryl transferase [Pseudomonadota bacterium]
MSFPHTTCYMRLCLYFFFTFQRVLLYRKAIMHPVLINIPFFGGLTIHTYGFMVALGFLAGILWIRFESKRVGVDVSRMLDLVFYLVLIGILASRLAHLLISERADFFADPLLFFKMWRGGLVFLGGVIPAILVAVWYLRRHKMGFWKPVDILSPALALGHMFGRIGCLMAGCCFGKESSSKWCYIVFPNDPHTFAPVGIHIFPTQLIEALGEAVIFSILFVVSRKKRFDGQVFATYLILYSVLRFFNEMLRGDLIRGFVIEPWLSTSQFGSLLLFVAGLIIYFTRWKKRCDSI